MANPWFRLYTEIIDDEKMRLLAFEDRWHYVAILCCKNAGLIDAGDSNAMLMRKLGVKLGLAGRELEAALLRLEEVGLIDAHTAQPTAWDDRQFLSDSSTARVQAYRERKKRLGNVTVTAQDTDTDTETEKKKERASPTGSRLPADWTAPEDWLTWARNEKPGINALQEADKFKDFWHSKAGKDGRKANWQATWRNWIRNSRHTNGYASSGYGNNGSSEPVRRRNEL